METLAREELRLELVDTLVEERADVVDGTTREKLELEVVVGPTTDED